MKTLDNIVEGKLVEGKRMNEPYLTIWRSFLSILAIIVFGISIQFLSWIANFVNYVVR